MDHSADGSNGAIGLPAKFWQGVNRRTQMATLTINADGRITLSRELLLHLGIQPGQKVVIEKLPGRHLAIQAAKPVRRTTQKETMPGKAIKRRGPNQDAWEA